MLQNADPKACLAVDRFMSSIQHAKALRLAFDWGLIGYLEQTEAASVEEVAKFINADSPGAIFEIGMLKSAGVVQIESDKIRLSAEFVAVLPYRDLILAKLDFAQWVESDFYQNMDALITDPQRFFSDSRLFELFDYSKCFDVTEENLSHAKRWVDITSVLTRYEAMDCLNQYDFSQHRSMLDIGGNSGEFALQACRQNPQLRATVLDLPVVCELGRRHLAEIDQKTAERVDFVEVGSEAGFSQQFDLVTYKSMLHDWPDERVDEFLAMGASCLAAGGELVIYERGPFDIERSDFGYSNLPLMLFFRSYRGAEFYVAKLERLGFHNIRFQNVQREMPFFVLNARKRS